MIRYQAIDFFRLIAIMAVISIHTSPFGGDASHDFFKYLNIIINQSARFAVPFFFIISGYFWGIKVRNDQQLYPATKKMIKRLFLVFMFWSFIYILPYGPEHLGEIEYFYSGVIDIIKNPIYFAFNGTKVHLWFLVSLGLAVFIVALFLHLKAMKLLIAFSILLYLFGLAAASYSETALGIHIKFNTRNGPFFSTIFFLTGYILSTHRPTDSYLKYGFIIAAIGSIFHFGEISYLYTSYGVYPGSHDYVLGTYFMGLGIALMALSDHPAFHSKIISMMGKYVLGIYVVHLIFVDTFRNIDLIFNSPLWEVSYVFVILFLSFGATYILSRFKIMKSVLK